jgi:hypothetical protein
MITSTKKMKFLSAALSESLRQLLDFVFSKIYTLYVSKIQYTFLDSELLYT